MKAPTEARPHKDAKYCWTCKRSIAPSHWGRHQKSAAHGRRVLGIPHPDGRPVKTQHGNSAAEAAEADTQPRCGGCSRPITPGHAYWRDDGCAYHNGCVPLATTRPLDPTQTSQAAPPAGLDACGRGWRPVGRREGRRGLFPNPGQRRPGQAGTPPSAARTRTQGSEGSSCLAS